MWTVLHQLPWNRHGLAVTMRLCTDTKHPAQQTELVDGLSSTALSAVHTALSDGINVCAKASQADIVYKLCEHNTPLTQHT